MSRLRLASLVVMLATGCISFNHYMLPKRKLTAPAGDLPTVMYRAQSFPGAEDPAGLGEYVADRLIWRWEGKGLIAEGGRRDELPKPDFVLTIGGSQSVESWGHPDLTGMTGFLIPYIATTNLRVTAFLENTATEETYTAASENSSTIVIQFFLAPLFVFGVLPAYWANEDIFDDLYYQLEQQDAFQR